MSLPSPASFMRVSQSREHEHGHEDIPPSGTPQGRSTSEEYSMMGMETNMSVAGSSHTLSSISYPDAAADFPKFNMDLSQLRITDRGNRNDVPLAQKPLFRSSNTNSFKSSKTGFSKKDTDMDTSTNPRRSRENINRCIPPKCNDVNNSSPKESVEVVMPDVPLQSIVQVVILGGRKSGKTSLMKNLRWGRGTHRSESGQSSIDAGNFLDDGRLYNVFDMDYHESLGVLPKLFINSESLVIIVWNMGFNNPSTFHEKDPTDSPSDAKRKKRMAIRSLDRHIDETVQRWIDEVQLLGPGASIVLVCSFDDMFDDAEAQRRCLALRKRLEKHELKNLKANPNYVKPYIHPQKQAPIRRISSVTRTGLTELMDDITDISDGLRDMNGFFLAAQRDALRVPSLQSFIRRVNNTVKRYSYANKNEVVAIKEFSAINDKFETNERLAKVAASYLSSVGNVCYFGNSRRAENSFIKHNTGTLDHHVVINHMLLVEAAKSVLMHESFIGLQREIEEAKIDLGEDFIRDGLSILAENCSACQIPIVTHAEACVLWKISDTIAEYAQKPELNVATFFHELMVRYGAFIPIKSKETEENLYLIPSLLEDSSVNDIWTYKCGESWKTTLCYSWLFLDTIPSNLMERVITSVTQDIIPYIIEVKTESDDDSDNSSHLLVREVLCGKTTMYLKLGLKTEMKRESIMEIFIHLAEQDSPLCVSSSTMLIGTRRLVASAKGAVGAEGRMIWNGGFDLIIKSIDKVFKTFADLRVDKEIVCPDCLASHKPVSQASVWKYDIVESAASRDQEEIRCRNAHPVKVPLISGQFKETQQNYDFTPANYETCTPVSKLLGGVVLVGLFDKTSGRILRAGSGFVVDTKRGLIVTASHTLIDMDNHTPEGNPNSNFGEWYYGLEDAEVIIGVIPKSENGETKTAVYRYFAKVLMADVRNVDACVLWITKKLVKDLDIDGDIGDDHAVEDVRYKPQGYFETEGLTKLDTTSTCEYEERVRVLGYNQGGEGLLERGAHVNRTADFSVGYVCKKFQCPKGEKNDDDEYFRPREEIVVIRCPTIGGHSGGPCVNQIGKVIGILSRSDPAEAQRCYIAPSSEWSELVRMAKGRVKFVRRLQNFL